MSDTDQPAAIETATVAGDPPNPKPEPVGFKAKPAEEKRIAAWKAAYVLYKRAEKKMKAAKAIVHGLFKKHGASFVESKLGILKLRSGGTNVDWKGLAHANIAADVIERELPKYTTVGEKQLAALPSWGAEAK